MHRITTAAAIAALIALLTGCSHDDDSAPSGPTQTALMPFLLVGHDGLHGVELFRSDGTARGTLLLRDIGNTAVDFPQYVRAKPDAASQWVFVQQDQIWRTDGTTGGTVPAAPMFDWVSTGAPELPRDTWLGDRVLFIADDRLWALDLITGGVTALTADACAPTVRWLDETSLRLDGTLYFFGTECGDDATTWTLWKTDATAEGTTAVADLPGTSRSGVPDRPVRIGDRFVFAFKDGTSGLEPWVSDGTQGGTQLLADIVSGSAGSGPYITSVVVNGRLLLFARDPANTARRRLYATDGTTTGTVSLGTNPPPSATEILGQPVVHNDLAYYTVLVADEEDGEHWLWVTDGTAEGTRSLFRFAASKGLDMTQPIDLFSVGEHLYARLWSSDGHSELQRVDMITGTTHSLSASSKWLQPWADVNGQLLFLEMLDTELHNVWRTDGTVKGTRLVTTFRLPSCPVPHAENIVLAIFLCVVGDGELVRDDTLLFLAHDPLTGNELWRTDGTAAGTHLVMDLWPGDGAGVRGLVAP